MKPDATVEGLVHDIWILAGSVRSVESVFSLREENREAHSVTMFVLKEGARSSGIVLVLLFCIVI